MNVSLVYNNKKLIGKCSKYAIEKVQGTSPFVMLENFEPKQPQLNPNQQIVLKWLKNIFNSPIIINPIAVVFALHNELVKDNEIDAVEAYEEMVFEEEIQVLQAFSQWALEQEEE